MVAQTLCELSSDVGGTRLFVYMKIMINTFIKYINRPHTHIIAGMNLPIIMSVALNNSQEYFSEETIKKLVNQAKDSLVYVNLSNKNLEKEDE